MFFVCLRSDTVVCANYGCFVFNLYLSRYCEIYMFCVGVLCANACVIDFGIDI